MYETRSQDELVTRGESLVKFVASGLAIMLALVFLLTYQLTNYLWLWVAAFLVWGAFFGFFIFEWRFELRAKAITDLFPENRMWYEVRPKRHTRRRLSSRRYYIQRSGTTLRIRTVYLSTTEEPRHKLHTIDYKTFMSNYVLMKENSAQ